MPGPLRFYGYRNCDTCRKALRFLVAHQIAHEEIPIREQPPTRAELKQMLQWQGGDLRKLFNTSGQDYRAMNLKDRLPKLSENEAFDLLSRHGNLVKRPFALNARGGRVGFDENDWRNWLT